MPKTTPRHTTKQIHGQWFVIDSYNPTRTVYAKTREQAEQTAAHRNNEPT